MTTGGVYVLSLLLVLLHTVEINGLELECSRDLKVGTPIPAQGTICENGWDSDITFNNTIIAASTAVLVEWNHYMNTEDMDKSRRITRDVTRQDDPVYYEIFYGPFNSVYYDSIITTEDSIILVHLEKETTYCINICVNGTEKCCNNIFQTVESGNLINKVMNVRAHVYKPLLNGDSITAQLIWQQLPQATSYDIRIFTADSSMEMIAEGSFNNLQEPFLNIVTRTDMNNLSFPLISDQLYIAQVRGNELPWSEPIWINTAYPNPAYELFVFDENQVGVIYQLYENENLLEDYFRIGRTPFALDKRNRIVFYTSSDNNIWKRNIDDQVYPFFKLDGIVPLAMSYDWIAKKLYVSVRNGTQLMIYYLLDVGNIEDRNMIHVYTSETPISDEFQTEMTINPFKGLLHWIEETEEGICLVQYDLENMESDVLHDNLTFSTLAENIEQNCIYTIINEMQNITISSVPVQEYDDSNYLCDLIYSLDPQDVINVERVRMSLDETGIYIHVELYNGTDRLFYLYYNGVIEQIGELTLSGFATTSPGTQPLPEKIECLSPDFEIESNRPVPDITEKSETSFIITWNTSSVDCNCHSVVVSTPPLIYTVYVNISGDDSIPGFPKTLYSNTLIVSGLNNSVQYIVSISARNEFTLFDTTQEDVADFRGNEVTFGFSQFISATTPTTSSSSSPTTTTMRTSTTLSRSTPTQNDPHTSIRATSTLGNSISSSSSSSIITVTSQSISSSSSIIIVTSQSISSSSSIITVTSQGSISSNSIFSSTFSLSTSIPNSNVSTSASTSTPTPLDPAGSSGQTALVAGVTGGIVFILTIMIVIIIVIVVILCIKKKQRIKSDEDNNYYSTATRYVHYEGVPYETPSTLGNSTNPTPIINSQNSNPENGIVTTNAYAVPSDSLEQYHANLTSSTFVQEYEEPSSINNTIAREPENSQPTEETNVYSSLTTARHLYSSYTEPEGGNPNYTPLHPPNMDDKHAYTSTINSPVSTFMNKEPGPYSEPVTSSTHRLVSKLESSDSYYKPGHEFNSHESSNTDTYLQLDRRGNNKGHINQTIDKAVDHVGDNPVYFALEQKGDSNKPKSSEPTYFELERRDGGTGTGTGTKTGTTPLYFQLERRDGTGIGTNTETNKETNVGNETIPLYSELEKRDGTGTGTNTGTTPLYFELEKKDGTRTGNGSNTGTTPVYFELERKDGTRTRTENGSNTGTTPIYFELERKDGTRTENENGTNTKTTPVYFEVERNPQRSVVGSEKTYSEPEKPVNDNLYAVVDQK